MERRLLITITGIALPIVLGLTSVASAQTPEPAAGNPAINSTPSPSNSNGVQSGLSQSGMGEGGTVTTPSSPSSAEAIPKGSNPDSGSGNMAAGSGATPSAESSDGTSPSQTANNPDDNAGGAAPMSQGRYTSPPTDTK